jgi:hypothetical protein
MNKSGFSSLSNNASTYCSLSATGLSISLAGKQQLHLIIAHYEFKQILE